MGQNGGPPDHLAGVAHHWLAILAVRSDQQGHGIGTALLSAYHERLDAAGIPGYLEAANRRSLKLYRRHGYDLRSNAPFHLPDAHVQARAPTRGHSDASGPAKGSKSGGKRIKLGNDLRWSYRRNGRVQGKASDRIEVL